MPDPVETPRFPELAVLVRPRATFRALAAAEARGSLWRRPAWTACVLGGVVSLAATGRLIPVVVLGATGAWAFVPALQVAALLAAGTAFGRGRLRAARAVDLFGLANVPWLLWTLGVVGAWLLAARPGVFAPDLGGAFLATLVAAQLGSTWLGYVFARDAAGLGRGAALGALAVYKLAFWGTIALWFVATEQLQPRWRELLGGLG